MGPDDDGASEFPDDDAPLSPSDTPTVDSASLRGVRRQQRARLTHDLQARAFWQKVFADPVGRREMYGILAAAHAFETRFGVGPAGFPQPEASWFHAGQQELGQSLFLKWQTLDRAGVFLMLDEHDPRFAQPTTKRGNDGR